MAEDLAATLFTEARAHHDAARRRFCIVIAALAVFHVMIFRPYVDLTEKKAAAAGMLTENTQLKQKLDEVKRSLERLNELSAGSAKARLDSLLGDLRTTFDRVNGVVEKLRNMGPESAAGDAGERLFSPEPASPFAPIFAAQIPNVRAQAAPMPPPAVPSLPAMDGSLRRGIASANSEQSLLVAIKPYIEQEIIAPRFSSFNKSWSDQVTPRVDAVGDELVKTIRAAASEFPGEAATWKSLEQAVSGVVTTARNFKIEPPPDPFWWSQSAAKEGTFHGFLRVLGETELSRSTVFAQLRDRIDEAISANRNQQAQIDHRIDELEKEFRAQQAELAEFAGPLKGVSIDLATIVPYTPLVLAAVFVALTGWLASRTQELGEAVAFMARKIPDSSAQDWLSARMTASFWHRPVSILARCVALASWVAFASWELLGASVVTTAQAALFGLAGAAGMVLASGYEWRVVRSLRGSSADGRAG